MSKRILVLDDEPWNVNWISDVAKYYGWEADFAPKYSDAENLYATHNHEIAIIDIRIGDEAPPPKGATLESIDPTWIGLRFVRHLVVEKNSKSAIFVYTGLDRADLRKTVEDTYKGRFFTKFESGSFEESLSKEIVKRSA